MRQILPRINIEDALPKNILKLRFNQDKVAERFGTFKNFLNNNDNQISRKRRPDIQKLIEDHYEKYGSSDEEDYEIYANPITAGPSINVSIVNEK